MNEQQRLEIAFGKDMGRFAIMQRKLNDKLALKLPLWHKKKLFCTSKSFEQSTNEFVAEYKAKHIFAGGDNLLSLTGGLGVDDVALSKFYNLITSLDTDEWLNEIVKVNNEKLGIKNINRICEFAENGFKNILKKTDVYIDPDRRAEKEQKGLDPTLFSPNVLEFIPVKSSLVKNLYVKLSPATDIQWIFTNLGNCEVNIIEFNKEVKELLCVFNTKTNNVVNMHVLGSLALNGLTMEWQTSENEIVWEPCAALNKTQWLINTTTIPLSKITKQGTLWLGYNKPIGMYGNSKVIISKGLGGIKQCKKELNALNIQHANITCKNYPSNPIAIRKELKLREGNQYHVYFAVNELQEKCWFITEN